MAEKSCVICGGEESEGEMLVQAPCHMHWVCEDDVASFFERATQNESLHPPKCCGQMFLLQEYEDYVPFEVAWAFQVKEHGEYATLAKFRVYCANSSCRKFLHPSCHITDPETKVTYAICEDEACGKWTCASCKVLLDQGTQNHTCTQNEEEEKFKETVIKNGYQECSVCGATVELAEACNHITCECGHGFCYVCGKEWTGLHGCPHYGQPKYDEEGYNQDGYHRKTGLDRDGLNRGQDIARRHGANSDEEDEEDDEEDDPDWEVMQHLTPAQRIMLNNLTPDIREEALDQLRIELFETQGIHFNTDPPPRPGAPPHIQPQIVPHIQAIADAAMQEAAARQGPVADMYEHLTRDRAQQIIPGDALFMLQQIDPQFVAGMDGLRPDILLNFASSLQPDEEHPNIPDIPRIVEELVPHLIERASQRLPDEEGDGLDEETDENQDPEGADEDAEVEDDGVESSDDPLGNDDNDDNDDDGDYTIDETVPNRFADDQSEDDKSDLDDDPGPATPATEEGKPHLWGPPGGWSGDEDEEL